MTHPRCPGCSKSLKASARVMSDGNEYLFYLCSECEDVVVEDPEDGSLSLHGSPSAAITDLVGELRSIAVEIWRKRSTSRKPLPTKRS